MTTESSHKALPHEVFLYLLMTIATAVAAVNIGTLLFQFVNLWVPDPAAYAYAGDSARSLIRWSVSSLVIFFPVLVWVLRSVNRDVAAHTEKLELRVRKWLMYFTLFVAGLILIGDAVALVYSFLQGDLTLRFVLKIVAILLVAGTVFSYYLQALHGSTKSRIIGRIASALVLAILVAGFWLAGSPTSQLHLRLDQQRAGDLQSIEYQILSYWQAKSSLPASLDDLRDGTIGGYTAPRDPATGEAYEYHAISARTYELCASFDLPSQDSDRVVPPTAVGDKMVQPWQHDAGKQCFQGTIDPQRFPPIKSVPL